ncbi:uncharacterized protein LOC131675175 [Phymastichus coffea]|uniref:uncharacterized protein LOC131675175 n=1 Tax=Phymastichus coffea TaxID=108790 RepID=UPI00273B4620|nr:uncharacterized protein LOC131675175 [Phymastichus coffea]
MAIEIHNVMQSLLKTFYVTEIVENISKLNDAKKQLHDYIGNVLKKSIEEYTLQKIEDTLNRKLTVRDLDLKRWALEKKRKHKITKLVTKVSIDNKPNLQLNCQNFVNEVKSELSKRDQKVERELQINGVDHLCSGKSVSCNDDVDLSCTNQINQVSSSSDIDSTLNIHEEEVHHTSAIQCSDSMEIIKPSIVETANYQNASSITSALSFYKGFQQANKYYIEGFKEGIKLEKQRMLKEVRNLQETQLPLPLTSFENFPITTNDFLNTSSISLITVPASTGSISSIIPNSPCMSNLESTFNSDSLASTEEICGTSQPIISSLNVSQSTAINDRPKVKAVSKKDNKSVRKTVHDFQKFLEKTRPHCVQQVHHLQQLNQQLQLQLDQAQTGQTERLQEDADTIKLHLQGPCPFFIDSLKYPKTTVNDEIMELGDGSHVPIDEAVNIFDSISFDRMSNDDDDRVGLKRNGILRSEEQNLSQIMNKDNAKSRSIQEISSMTSLSTFNLTTTPSQNQTNSSTLIQTSACQPLQKQVLNAFEAGLSIGIQTRLSDDNKRTQLVLQSNQIAFAKQSISPTSRIDTMDSVLPSDIKYSLDSTCLINQVQAATQTQLPLSLNTSAPLPDRKSFINTANNIKGKKNKHILGHHCSTQQSSISSSVQIPLSLSSQNYPIDSSTVSNNHTTSNFVETYSSNQIPTTPFSCMDVDSETDSNHDTALTLACAGGHEELVELLLSRGADIEHRDKKGFTPLILAATAGHQKVVEILLNHGADLEAQSERTKDTPLSLACSGGRYEVVELLLNRAANKEHRNVSDYTPLSLAASGGYVNIIKLLLNHGAEINSRTGSKLGISPLMLAAMNGHTAAVKLLLDMGSDINAQIETNRNTALTLACFQGRHEVVSLLLDRKANVEHRAKTGLTPLMEAASGGYVEVGRVLLSKGADVNAMPVPSSRDTALTIAADKGHCRFVELLLSKGTQVEVKNKKGNSPLWLAANGGHLNVVDLLYHAGANIDSQDNRKVSCLMAAFRKGHIKIIKWMVNHVTQFPSDQEMTRYVATISDKDILERCQECIKIIRAAKETQAAKANKNATILLEELDMEKTREESKKAAAARRRERKKKKKLEKKEEKRKLHAENNKNEGIYKINDMSKTRIDGNGSYNEDYHLNVEQTRDNLNEHTTELNKNISITEETKDNNTFTNIIEHDDMSMREKKKEKKKKKFACSSFNVSINESNMSYVHVISTAGQYSPSTTEGCFTTYDIDKHPADRDDFEATGNELCTSQKGKRNNNQLEIDVSHSTPPKLLNSTSPKYLGKRDEGWKEVVRKGQIEDSAKFVNASFRSKKVSVPPNAISRVIGRGGSNINSIRAATGAHIEIEKQSKSIGERIITIKGSFEATKQAHILISALIKNPDIDIIQLLSKSKLSCSINTIFVEKPNSSITTPKMKFVSTKSTSGFSSTTSEHLTKSNQVTSFSPTSYVLPLRSSTTNRSSISRFTSANDKKVLIHSMTQSNTKTTMSYTSAIMTSGRSSKVLATNISQTFAEKLSEINTISTAIDYSNSFQFNQVLHNAVSTANPSVHVSSVQSTVASNLQMQSHDTSSNNLLDSDTILSLVPVFTASSSHSSEKFNCQSVSNNLMTMNSSNMIITTTNSFSSQLIKVPQTTSISVNSPSITSLNECQNTACSVPLEYSLFNDTFSKVTQQSMWGSKEFENQKNINFATIAGAKVSVNNPVMPSNKFIDSAPIEVDASKAPGYRGILTCSPTSNLSNNFSSLGNNSTGDDGSLSSDKIVIQAEHVQLVDFTNDGILCGASKPPVNLISVRPHLHHNKDDKNMTTATSFMKMTSCENMKSSENAVTSPKGNDISLMSCQSNLEADIFDLNDESSNFENQSSSSNLIKTVTSESQSNAQCISIQRHIRTNNPQTIMPSAIVTTTISMSRLNPRAPDFSSSLHLGNNQQMTMLSTSTSRPTVFPIMSAQPSTSVIHSSNLTMVGGFTYNKYQTPFLRPTNPHHWPFLATPNYTHQDQLISQANYSDHIIGISSPSSNLDTINHENSHLRTPVMSLVSTGPTQEISHVQIEDRKPRPIGTERTWKNYSIIGPGGDTDNINWIPSQEKTTDSWPGILPNTDTNQLFDSNATFNRVLPNETDSHKTAESSFQGNHFRN